MQVMRAREGREVSVAALLSLSQLWSWTLMLTGVYSYSHCQYPSAEKNVRVLSPSDAKVANNRYYFNSMLLRT